MVAVSAAINRLEDWSPSVRQTALGAIRRLAGNEAAHALPLLIRRSFTDQEDPSIREALVSAIPLVANRGDLTAISTLIAHSRDSSCWVRTIAVAGLRQLTSDGDVAVLAAMLERTTDDSWQVRDMAAEVLGQLARDQHRAAALAALAALWDDKSMRVRRTAKAAIQCIVTSCSEGGATAEPGSKDGVQHDRSAVAGLVAAFITAAAVAIVAARLRGRA
jgi:hypothetical protein